MSANTSTVESHESTGRSPWWWVPSLYFAEGVPYVVVMTVAVIMAGLLPIMLGGGTGAEVMRRIAAPMVGGMITAPLLSMLVIPASYLLLRRRGLPRVAPVRTGAPVANVAGAR